ncbi:hypothetical protein HRI_003444500 [Hibiscus trionum]|uniref:RRM domain-containing protein n=1 Tax=Hibiscus trionum TaxID=183268 RepID=A0A9W7IJD0_HIBTR|nr:hypothetical protein HRI_003444500 [Hibiscus trionum]
MSSSGVSGQAAEWRYVKQNQYRSTVDRRREANGAYSRSGVWIVFVDNLSKRISRIALKELFNHHGRVERIFIPMNNSKVKYRESNTTFAFVTMATKAEMERVIANLNNTKMDGSLVRVFRARFLKLNMTQGNSNSPWQRKVQSGEENKQNFPTKKTQKTHKAAFDTRSYKDALLNKEKLEQPKICQACRIFRYQ